MPVAKTVLAQRDFSAGELDVSVKRSDENPLMRTGARQCANFRILNSKSVQNRPGRRALFLRGALGSGGRIDKILMSPGNAFFLACGNAGGLTVLNAAGTQVLNQGGFAWTNATEQKIVWTLFGMSIYITFPGQHPQVLGS